MNESERKAIYKEAYREAYRATENKAKARRAAKETMIACYPETATLLKISSPRVDKSKVAPDVLEDAAKLIAEMGAAAREVTLTDSATPKKSQPAPAFSGNGNGITANGNGEEGRARARVSVPLLGCRLAAPALAAVLCLHGDRQAGALLAGGAGRGKHVKPHQRPVVYLSPRVALQYAKIDLLTDLRPLP